MTVPRSPAETGGRAKRGGLAPARLLLAAATLMTLAGRADAADDAATAWARLAAPGTHALVRHAQAPGTGDPVGFRIGDCATQRNLDDTGRADARALGAALRAHAIPVTTVLSSQWCRTEETARLMAVGPVKPEPALNSFFSDGSTAQAQTRRIAARLRAMPAGEKAVLVTHQVNITALTGVVPASGEIVVVSAAPDGSIRVEGRIAPER